MFRYIYTLKYLKFIQIYYQIYYRILGKGKFHLPKAINLKELKTGNPLNFESWIDKKKSYKNGSFTFLNQTCHYPDFEINWDEKKYGTLWSYNLNYMDYLLQTDLSEEKGIAVIKKFIWNLSDNKTGLQPYPISLRGINWIKFLVKYKINDEEIDNSLYAQYRLLFSNIEYHLLGNHVLENGFSLLFGSFYFKDRGFYEKAERLIITQLKEQILDDGGHFELSPMYHQIILDRLLDSINLLQNNQQFEDQNELLTFLERKANAMLNWINLMTFKNKDVPHFNDSTTDVAPTTDQLFEYAERLGLNYKETSVKLGESGYRKFACNNYECFVDVGPLGPDYIPGHAHADMMSFVLCVNQQPVIIDTGISSYEKNKKRQLERSTSSHNTVVVNGKNQSDVWGGFRVGKRAKIKVIEDNDNFLVAFHNGYKPFIHLRKFKFTDNGFVIMDEISGKKNKGKEIYTSLHFDRHVLVKQNKNELVLNNKQKINIQNATNIVLKTYSQPLGFNKYAKSQKAMIFFKSHLTTTFSFK